MSQTRENVSSWPDADQQALKQRLAEAPAVSSQYYDDFVLAMACLAGSAKAQQAFHQSLHALPLQLAHLTTDAHLVDEVMQTTAIRLIVDKRLGSYRGRGALAGFVRVVATRICIDMLRKQQRAKEIPHPTKQIIAENSPELRVLRQAYGGALAEALASAWDELEPDNRLLLQMMLDAVSIKEAASLLGIHRTSAARRVVRARRALMDLCREKLRASLGCNEETLDSIVRLFNTSAAWEPAARALGSR